MDWLTPLYYQVKQHLIDCLPPYWQGLGEIVEGYFRLDILPEIILPLSTCKAVGGNTAQAVVPTAAAVAALIGVRILDDINDKQNPNALWVKVGIERAFNIAQAFQTLAHQMLGELIHSEQMSYSLYNIFVEGLIVTMAGRERANRELTRDWANYWKIAEMKTAYLFAMLAAIGAGDGRYLKVCQTYGYHLGLALQVLKDLEGTWKPNKVSDLQRGKITLPVLYGIEVDHPAREELTWIVRRSQVALHAQRIKEILDTIDAKSYLLWVALQQRGQALKAIQVCPDEEGKKTLKAYFMEWFVDAPGLSETAEIDLPESMKIEIPISQFNVKETDGADISITYQSVGLGLRQKLRKSYQ